MKSCWLVLLALFSALPAFASESTWRLCARVENGKEISMTHYRMTLNLRDAFVSGKGGCNSYGGDVVQNKKFLFENIRVTQMACLDENGNYDRDLMEAEGQFLSSLSLAQEMIVSGATLRILTADRTELRFAPEGSCR